MRNKFRNCNLQEKLCEQFPTEYYFDDNIFLCLNTLKFYYHLLMVPVQLYIS